MIPKESKERQKFGGTTPIQHGTKGLANIMRQVQVRRVRMQQEKMLSLLSDNNMSL